MTLKYPNVDETSELRSEQAACSLKCFLEELPSLMEKLEPRWGGTRMFGAAAAEEGAGKVGDAP